MATTSQSKVPKASGRFRWPTCGPGRRLAIGVIVGWIAVAGVMVWRMGSLDGLPDVGDPFDVAEARRPVEIPDADNAFVAYAVAHKLVDPADSIDEARRCLLVDALWGGEIKRLTWSSALPGLREYLELERAALEFWREGSRRRDAVYHQPGRLSFGSEMNLIEDANVFAAMAAPRGLAPRGHRRAGRSLGLVPCDTSMQPAHRPAWDARSALIWREDPLPGRLLHPPMGGRPASRSRTAPTGTATTLWMPMPSLSRSPRRSNSIICRASTPWRT